MFCLRRPLRFLLPVSITFALAPSGAGAGVDAWIPINGPAGQGATYFLAVRPTYPSEIFAGTGSGRLLRSSDAGATWTPIGVGGAGLPAYVSGSITFDPSSDSILYSTAPTLGVFKSVDNGATFTSARAGLFGITNVSPVVVDPKSPTTLYTSTDAGVFKSTDGGVSWTQQLGHGLPPPRSAVTH